MMTLQNIILIITGTTTALSAGVFYTWSCAVIPGMARLSNTEYIRAMQSFNSAIQNPVFFISFLGTAVLLPVCSYLHYNPVITNRFWFLLAATIIYLIGVLGVTIFGNIPLNENLAGFNLQTALPETIALQRTKFEIPWNNLNTIRTASSILAIILVIIACIKAES